MFIEVKPAEKPMKRPGKMVIRGKPEEKDRLFRRAREIFPQTEIIAEAGEQFLCASLPLTEELFKFIEKFSLNSQHLSQEIRDQSYFLAAKNDGFCIIAHSPAGLFYGMLGLAEFLEKKVAEIELFDYPRYRARGFLQDLSRGQVLTRSGFERLVRALGSCRYNWLTFNLEHNFGYRKHPEISEADDALTINEAKALSELCREYYLEAVPMQQSLGHCRGILSRPEHRSLAFDDQLLWSLDPGKEGTYSLLRDFFEEQAESFPSKYFFVGCDEPFDLKKLWKPEAANGKQFPQLYLDHLLKLHKIVSGLGRQMMVWGDVFVSHSELLAKLPKDIIIINWQYGTSEQEDEDYYEQRSKAIAESGKEFYVATTTFSYARLFPELKTMAANNRNFLNVGSRLNASGALLANWGDLGHMQLLGHISLPIAYFASHSWRENRASLEDFSRDFAAGFFADQNGKAGEFFILLDRVNDIISPGRSFGASGLFILLDDLFSSQFLPDRKIGLLSEDLLKILKAAAQVTSSLSGIKNYDWILDLKPVIYSLGILFTKFLIKENAPLVVKDSSKKEEMAGLFQHLLNYCRTLEASLKDRWLAQAKPLGLERNLARLAKAAQGYQKRLEQMRNSDAKSFEELRDAPEFEQYRFNLIKEMGMEGLK